MDSHSFRKEEIRCKKGITLSVWMDELFCKLQACTKTMETRLMTRFSSHPGSSGCHEEQLQILRFSGHSSDDCRIAAASIILLARVFVQLEIRSMTG